GRRLVCHEAHRLAPHVAPSESTAPQHTPVTAKPRDHTPGCGHVVSFCQRIPGPLGPLTGPSSGGVAASGTPRADLAASSLTEAEGAIREAGCPPVRSRA